MTHKEILRLLRRLTLATNRMDGAYYLFARRRGVNENTLALLYAIDGGQPHSQKQVCEEWLIPKTTINTIVRQLEAEGYLTLRHDGRGREKTLCLTPTGMDYARSILGDIYAAEDAAMEAALKKFSPAFVDALEEYTAVLCAEFEARTGGAPNPKIAADEQGDRKR